ncbi:SsrA-binding protein SmpB [Prochlorococcus sp. MIT 1223]|uniref:SsrA-binding protein SmpB n=1 Tax=Prochlorococcus sp. MIT 1223 TaxID=3096217 RepID=UPI002A7630E8|nr:SsrA-binding protein SmpB [Prochlorococcus sp. MIT 1223]
MTKIGNSKSKKGRFSANQRLAENRFARHQYEIIDTLETGIELLGTEVKSIRAGKANLRDGFCIVKKGELQLHNVHISPHNHSSNFYNHDPLRVKRLLAHRKEINRLKVELERKGLTLIPLSLQLKGSWIKLIIGLGKGRKLHDKRHMEKEKQTNKEAKLALKHF